MLSHEHLKLLLQGVAVVLALHFAKGSMTGEYRNLVAVGLVAVVLVVVNHLFSEYEGADTNYGTGPYGLRTIDCMKRKVGKGAAFDQWLKASKQIAKAKDSISSKYRWKIDNGEKACGIN